MTRLQVHGLHGYGSGKKCQLDDTEDFSMGNYFHGRALNVAKTEFVETVRWRSSSITTEKEKKENFSH